MHTNLNGGGAEAAGWGGKFKAALLRMLGAAALVLLTAAPALASEADLAIPDLHKGRFFTTPDDPDSGISAWNLLLYGALVISGTLGISLYLRSQIHKLPAHKSMLDIAEIIFQTCKTYLIQQGKFLLMLFVLIAAAMTYYFIGLAEAKHAPTDASRCMVLLFSRRRHGRLVLGRLVRHPRQHLRQLPAPPSPRSAASRGTSSTFRCGPACRSACS